MFIKERKNIKENMDKKLIQKEKVCAEIQRQNDLYNNAYRIINKYNSFKSAKKFLSKIIKFLVCWCGGGFISCFILPHDLFFPMKETEELINFVFFSVASTLLSGYFSMEQIQIIIKNRTIKKDDYNKAMQDAKKIEHEITKLKSKYSSLVNEIAKYEDALTFIDELHKNINNILAVSGQQQHFIYTNDFIKEKFQEELREYLNESVDYSKISVTPEIKIEHPFVKKYVKKK